MKKNKKLSLNRETLALLNEESRMAVGGNTHWSNCFCSNGTACCSSECATQTYYCL